MNLWILISSPIIPATSPLVTWFDVGATTIVLIIFGALLAGMFMFIRIVSDDSDKFKELKEMVETMFGTPAHLRPSIEQPSAKKEDNNISLTKASFSEPCPACEETVTEHDESCPSCGLQLL